MKLHYAPASPFVRKVMVAAIELGLDEQIEKVETVPVPTDTNMELAAENPLAKIPTLITDEGDVLYDSRLITAWLNELSVSEGGRSLVPEEGQAKWLVLRHEALCDGMLDAAVITRYEQAMRPEELQWPDWIEAQMGRVRRGLDFMEKTMDNWAGHSGSDVGLASIAAGCVCGYLDFRYESFTWRKKRPKLADWFERFSERPSMKQTVPHA